MNRPDRGVILGAVVSAVVLPAAVAAAAIAPTASRPAGVARLATRPPAVTTSAVRARAAGPAGGWRMVTADHYGQLGNASGYATVVAPGQQDAWVFGGTNPGAASSPVAVHWNGHAWQTARLPAGLGSFISAASASSPVNVWALSSFGGYVLRWNGNQWSVARRWQQPGTDAACLTVISSADVWLFGTTTGSGQRAGVWNYNGRGWMSVPGPRNPVCRASAVSRRDIWAITAAPKSGLVEHWDGRAWNQVRTSSLLAGTQLDDVVAVSRHSVWVLGNSPATTPAGRVILAHWNGRNWRRFTAPGRAMPRRLAPDGRGGVWVTATTLGAQTESRLLHLSRSGRWTQTDIRHGLGNAISDLALIPGTSSLWGSGGFLTRAGGDAAVWLQGSGRPLGHRDDPRLASEEQDYR
jgi:hypothetical protein